MTRYLFVGPSLPDAADLLTMDDITVLPPVEAGDLLRLAPRQGDVVGIIDGYFHHTRAVRHKEILTLLDAGVQVLGAAGMGALRAAELDTFGMRGVGRIYRDYRQGRLTADDEVALSHGPTEERYRPISEPLVNIRATLHLCLQEGVLDESTAGQLVADLSRRPYRMRSYPELIRLAREAGMPEASVQALQHLSATRAVNLQRDDALLLVQTLRTLEDGQANGSAPYAANQPGFTVAPTVYLHRWQLGARGVDTGDGWTAEMSILRMCQLFARDYPRFYRDLVFGHLAQECANTCQAQQAETTLDTVLAHARHRSVVPDIRSAGPEDLSFLDLWLTTAERTSRSLADQLGTFVVRSFQLTPGVPADTLALDALRRRQVIPTVAKLVAAARSVNEHAQQIQSGFDIHTLSADRILSHLSELWGVEPGTLELHALNRGIGSLDVLTAAARPYHLLAKYNPDLVDLRVTPTTRT
ncbi:TfuA-like protein [Actinoallomurus purpureus]|uniref:TfuA-like protein n=1 Tax=Actinoallomurus purpureus TaxID=478114 RepID=UPI0020929EA7|nr:TfuA-like protein [Actinoallomurus purpureus]MCO6009942.1 TfuA-like protein [Actinoallomurus purpureus]